jgi:hypothetical protein
VFPLVKPVRDAPQRSSRPSVGDRTTSALCSVESKRSVLAGDRTDYFLLGQYFSVAYAFTEEHHHHIGP